MNERKSLGKMIAEEKTNITNNHVDTHAVETDDSSIACAAYDEYIKSGRKSRPISELWKELDL